MTYKLRVSIIHSIQGYPMSTLIPSIASCKDVTPGERRFARLLEAKLEDDYLCWYNVPIGPSRLHPDFIIMHPQRGLLVLEVKDWRLSTIQSINSHEATIQCLNTTSKPSQLWGFGCFGAQRNIQYGNQFDGGAIIWHHTNK